MASARRLALAAALALATTGCDYYYNDIPSPDELWYIVPWFDHMLGSPAIDPYETAAVPRNTLPGTVPVSGADASWEAEWITGNFAAADRLVNPLAGGGPTLEGLLLGRHRAMDAAIAGRSAVNSSAPVRLARPAGPRPCRAQT